MGSSIVSMIYMSIYKRTFYKMEVMNGIANNPQARVVTKERAQEIIEEVSNKNLENTVK